MTTTPDTSCHTASFATAAALFVLGFGLFILCRRSEFLHHVPAMIVVAPILILRFSRVLPVRRAMLLTVVGFVMSINLALWDIFDMSEPPTGVAFNFVRSTLIGLLYAMPYLIDRAVMPRLENGLWTTLIFPVAATAVMFLPSLEGPLDGTQANNVYGIVQLPILQFYALTGLWGSVFLWSWLAALVNHAWEHGIRRRQSIAAAMAFVIVSGGPINWGAWRFATAPDVPTRGVATPYARLGDWLGWGTTGLMLLLAAFACSTRPKHLMGAETSGFLR